MQNLILYFFAIVYSCALGAQEYDLNWIVGYNERYDLSKVYQGHTQLNFKTDVNIKFLDASIPLCDLWLTNGCISDEQGRLLFFTDGHRVYGKNFGLSLNGDTISPSIMWEPFLGNGYPEQNGALFLPIPKKKNKYVLFHKGVTFDEEIEGRDDLRYCNMLYYSVLEDSQDSNGVVLKKNIPLLQTYINDSEMAACKHGNGTDYWVVIKTMGTNEYYFYLLDSTGVKFDHTQKIGAAHTKNDWNGNSVFSRDGAKFARILPEDGLEVFDFDRCIGLLSNARQVNFPDSRLLVSSVAFSPSGRFVYISSINSIWQYDLEEPDLQQSETKIISRDSFISPLNNKVYYNGYFQMRLAPDDKIYVVFFGSNHFMTRIHRPDEKGVNCDPANYDIVIPAWMGGSLPLFPNFKLGVLSGSDCDDLNKIDELSYDEEVVYPCLRLINLHGAVIKEFKNKSIHELKNLSEVNKGIYFVILFNYKGKSKTYKIWIN